MSNVFLQSNLEKYDFFESAQILPNFVFHLENLS
jgi:hypothetical protein